MNRDYEESDLALFNEIYFKYKNIIYYWIKRKTSNSKDYDDIFQETTMKLYSSIKSYDINRGSLKNYIKVITDSCVCDYYRKSDNHIILD